MDILVYKYIQQNAMTLYCEAAENSVI